MTSLELKLDLPDRLAREAQAAGLLTPKALKAMVADAVRRRAAQRLLAGAELASSRPLPTKVIQSEVNTVRRARRAKNSPLA